MFERGDEIAVNFAAADVTLIPDSAVGVIACAERDASLEK